MISEADNRQSISWPAQTRADAGAMGNITIDCVILSFQKGRLKFLVQELEAGSNAGQWILPGGWVQHDESLDEAAERYLRETVGVEQAHVEQLRAFGEVKRIDDRRIITVAYTVLLCCDEEQSLLDNDAGLSWRDVEDPRKFIYDHNQILEQTLAAVRHKVRHEPIVFNLLPQKFTLLQLQELYEAILGLKLDKPNFRRKMMKMKLLESCGEKQQNVAHRAAELYCFDPDLYAEKSRKGFRYEV